MKIFLNLFFLFILAFTYSCASRNPDGSQAEVSPEKKIYDEAQERLKNGSYSLAIDALESLERSFPFGKYAEQAQAELIYAYYENGLYDAATRAAERFISLHPRHPNTDYAYFMKGLASFSKDKELLSSLPVLGDLTYKRDLSSAKESFNLLTEFLTRFPESTYVEDAKRRMLFLRNLIADQEIEIAQFYMKRKAYIAAVNRADFIISSLPNSPVVRKALEIKVEAYALMEKKDLADQAQKILDRFIKASKSTN